MKELHIVLHKDIEGPNEYFVETEDEEGRGVGNFTLPEFKDRPGYRHVVVTKDDFK